MSFDIQQYQGNQQLLPRDARRTGRAISRYAGNTQLRTAEVDYETDVTLSKVGSSTTVTASMMADVVRVAQAQQHLELMAPAASGRLALIADNHVLGLMELEADHRRGLRRI